MSECYGCLCLRHLQENCCGFLYRNFMFLLMLAALFTKKLRLMIDIVVADYNCGIVKQS